MSLPPFHEVCGASLFHLCVLYIIIHFFFLALPYLVVFHLVSNLFLSNLSFSKLILAYIFQFNLLHQIISPHLQTNSYGPYTLDDGFQVRLGMSPSSPGYASKVEKIIPLTKHLVTLAAGVPPPGFPWGRTVGIFTDP